jgi:hypothetical protein
MLLITGDADDGERRLVGAAGICWAIGLLSLK